jgi:hypothetical protein
VDQAAAHVYHEETKNPQDEEYYRDRPKHDGILARSELHPAPTDVCGPDAQRIIIRALCYDTPCKMATSVPRA